MRVRFLLACSTHARDVLMTRRISKNGNAYTEGSSGSRAGWEPKLCAVCGERVLHSKEAVLYDMDDRTGETRARHSDCVKAAKAAA